MGAKGLQQGLVFFLYDVKAACSPHKVSIQVCKAEAHADKYRLSPKISMHPSGMVIGADSCFLGKPPAEPTMHFPVGAY